MRAATTVAVSSTIISLLCDFNYAQNTDPQCPVWAAVVTNGLTLMTWGCCAYFCCKKPKHTNRTAHVNTQLLVEDPDEINSVSTEGSYASLDQNL